MKTNEPVYKTIRAQHIINISVFLLIARVDSQGALIDNLRKQAN